MQYLLSRPLYTPRYNCRNIKGCRFHYVPIRNISSYHHFLPVFYLFRFLLIKKYSTGPQASLHPFNPPTVFFCCYDTMFLSFLRGMPISGRFLAFIRKIQGLWPGTQNRMGLFKKDLVLRNAGGKPEKRLTRRWTGQARLCLTPSGRRRQRRIPRSLSQREEGRKPGFAYALGLPGGVGSSGAGSSGGSGGVSSQAGGHVTEGRPSSCEGRVCMGERFSHSRGASVWEVRWA